MKVAKKYGVSDVALAKTCKKLNVPVPGRGYWAKVRSGQKLPQDPLPTFENPPRIPVRNGNDRDSNTQKEEARFAPEAFMEAEKLKERELHPEMQIMIPATPDHLHPWVQSTRKLLRMKGNRGFMIPNEYGRVFSKGGEAFEVAVGPASVERVTYILQALCSAFSIRGFELGMIPEEHWHPAQTCVKIMGEEIRFRFYEPSNRKKLEKKIRTGIQRSVPIHSDRTALL